MCPAGYSATSRTMAKPRCSKASFTTIRDNTACGELAAEPSRLRPWSPTCLRTRLSTAPRGKYHRILRVRPGSMRIGFHQDVKFSTGRHRGCSTRRAGGGRVARAVCAASGTRGAALAKLACCYRMLNGCPRIRRTARGYAPLAPRADWSSVLAAVRVPTSRASLEARHPPSCQGLPRT